MTIWETFPLFLWALTRNLQRSNLLTGYQLTATSCFWNFVTSHHLQRTPQLLIKTWQNYVHFSYPKTESRSHFGYPKREPKSRAINDLWQPCIHYREEWLLLVDQHKADDSLENEQFFKVDAIIFDKNFFPEYINKLFRSLLDFSWQRSQVLLHNQWKDFSEVEFAYGILICIISIVDWAGNTYKSRSNSQWSTCSKSWLKISWVPGTEMKRRKEVL